MGKILSFLNIYKYKAPLYLFRAAEMRRPAPKRKALSVGAPPLRAAIRRPAPKTCRPRADGRCHPQYRHRIRVAIPVNNREYPEISREEGGGIPKTNRNDETIDCLLRPGLRTLRRPQGYHRQRRRPSGAHRPEMERNERCTADHGRDHPLYGLPHGGSEIRLLQRLVPDPQMRIGKGAFDLRRLPRGRRLPDRRRDLPARPRREGESAGSGDLLNLSGSARRASAHRSASPKNA